MTVFYHDSITIYTNTCNHSDSKVVERFLRFHVSTTRSADTLSGIVKGILSKYGDSLKDKLIMQTNHDTAVLSGHLNGLETLICKGYLYAFFPNVQLIDLN